MDLNVGYPGDTKRPGLGPWTERDQDGVGDGPLLAAVRQLQGLRVAVVDGLDLLAHDASDLRRVIRRIGAQTQREPHESDVGDQNGQGQGDRGPQGNVVQVCVVTGVGQEMTHQMPSRDPARLPCLDVTVVTGVIRSGDIPAFAAVS